MEIHETTVPTEEKTLLDAKPLPWNLPQILTMLMGYSLFLCEQKCVEHEFISHSCPGPISVIRLKSGLSY